MANAVGNAAGAASVDGIGVNTQGVGLASGTASLLFPIKAITPRTVFADGIALVTCVPAVIRYRITVAQGLLVDVPLGYDILTDTGFVHPSNLLNEDVVFLEITLANTSFSFTPAYLPPASLTIHNTRQFLVLSVELVGRDTQVIDQITDGPITIQSHQDPLVCPCVLLRDNECGLKYYLPLTEV